MTWRTCFSYLFEGAYNTTLHLLGGFKTRSISLGELSFQARGKIADLTLWSIYIYIYICLNIPWRVSLNPQTDWFFKALGVEVQTSSNNTGPAHSCRSATLKESKVTYPKVPENDWKLAPSWHKVSRTVLQQGFKVACMGTGSVLYMNGVT